MNNRGHRGTAWDICERCGSEYPVSHFRYQNGIRLCVDKCIDKRPIGYEEEEAARVGNYLGEDTDEGADIRWQDPIDFGESFRG